MMGEVEGIPGCTKEDLIHQVELNLWETWSNPSGELFDLAAAARFM
jgi:hypothetical protein